MTAAIAQLSIGTTNLSVVVADITTLHVDAIVNAANTSLFGGGGVDGAIHRKAGPELAIECRMLNGCKPGNAKMTKGYRLPAKHVIHTVGPVWQDGTKGEEAVLASCYRASLDLANKAGLASIAVPAISTGIYRFPADKAARIAVSTVCASLSESPLTEVIFCCYDQAASTHYEAAFSERR